MACLQLLVFSTKFIVLVSEFFVPIGPGVMCYKPVCFVLGVGLHIA